MKTTVTAKATMKAEKSCGEPGRVVPLIDRNRCEGKADCVPACPYDVFEIVVLDPEQRVGMSLKGRIKSFFHGYRQAATPRADSCHACGLCVAACPERAISLMRPAAEISR